MNCCRNIWLSEKAIHISRRHFGRTICAKLFHSSFLEFFNVLLLVSYWWLCRHSISDQCNFCPGDWKTFLLSPWFPDRYYVTVSHLLPYLTSRKLELDLLSPPPTRLTPVWPLTRGGQTDRPGHCGEEGGPRRVGSRQLSLTLGNMMSPAYNTNIAS